MRWGYLNHEAMIRAHDLYHLAGRVIDFFSVIVIAALFLSIPAHASDAIETSGDILQILLPMTAGGMTIYQDDREGFIKFSESFLTTVGTTYPLKYAIDKKRPNGGSHSFPSGHTAENHAHG